MPPCAPLPLPLARYRFTVQLQQRLVLPPFVGALLRSVFGAALREAACVTNQTDCPQCALWRRCSYPAIFETPPQDTPFAQQFSAVPNPYVIEPPPGGAALAVGDALVFHMVLMGDATLRQLPLIVMAWQRALAQGLGAQRATGTLQAVEHIRPDGGSCQAIDLASGRVLAHEPRWLAPVPTAADASAAPTHLTLHFDTPLRLQSQGRPLAPADLTPRTLVSQMLRRINLLLHLHLKVRPEPFDARALVALAATLVDDRSGLRWQDWGRYSARQGQAMNLGGVVGPWQLQGPLAPLLPWFELGQWLHLGKTTTMGLGAYRVGIDGA